MDAFLQGTPMIEAAGLLYKLHYQQAFNNKYFVKSSSVDILFESKDSILLYIILTCTLQVAITVYTTPISRYPI